MNGLFNSIPTGYRLQLIYVLMLVALLTLSRAYQTSGMAVPTRLSLWLVVCGLIVLQVRWIKSKLVALSWSPPLCALTAVVATTALMGLQLDWLKYTPLLPKSHDPYMEFVVFIFPAVVLVAGGSFLFDFVSSPVSEATGETKTSQESPVLVVHSQEHYLLLTTASGQQIRRARMTDLMDELSTVDGLQVHRCWWVNAVAVKNVTRQGRDYVLHLFSGGQVPVARSRVPLLKEAGWI